jgi:hypothetical protein
LAAELSDALSYGTICFPNVDDWFAFKPTSTFVLEVDFGSFLKRQSARNARFHRVRDTGNSIDTWTQLWRVLALPIAEWQRAIGNEVCKLEYFVNRHC